jgi:hypothetical protein
MIIFTKSWKLLKMLRPRPETNENRHHRFARHIGPSLSMPWGKLSPNDQWIPKQVMWATPIEAAHLFFNNDFYVPGKGFYSSVH